MSEVLKNLMFKSLQYTHTVTAHPHSAVLDLVERSGTDVDRLNLKAESVYKLLICKTKVRPMFPATVQKEMKVVMKRRFRLRWKS